MHYRTSLVSESVESSCSANYFFLKHTHNSNNSGVAVTHSNTVQTQTTYAENTDIRAVPSPSYATLGIP
jgi:hypothetical protein